MKTKDIMTTPVISVTPETSVPDVARLLLGHHISAVPVLDAGGHLVGIVSEGDFLPRAEEPGRRRRRLREDARPLRARRDDARRDHGHRGDADLRDGSPSRDEAHQAGAVLRGGQLVGIVSRADLLRAVAARREPGPAAASSVADETIRQQVLAEIGNAAWTPSYPLSVIVTDGIVQIWGVIDANRPRDALRVLAEGVPGVRGTEINVGTIPAYAWAQ